jgi:nucleoside phosphorylase
VSTGSSLDATEDEHAHFAATRALAKDMELAALAVVCRVHGVPLAAIKGVTDLVDHHEPTQDAFLRNLARTSARVAAAMGPFVEALAAHDAGAR